MQKLQLKRPQHKLAADAENSSKKLNLSIRDSGFKKEQEKVNKTYPNKIYQ